MSFVPPSLSPRSTHFIPCDQMDYILIRQKDRILNYLENGQIIEAKAALEVLQELWSVTSYSYKFDELHKRLVDLIDKLELHMVHLIDLSQEDVEAAHRKADDVLRRLIRKCIPRITERFDEVRKRYA